MADQALGEMDGLRETVRELSKPSSAQRLGSGRHLTRFAPPAECDIEQLLQWAYGKQQVHLRLREKERAGSSVSTGGRDSVVTVQMNWIHGGRISGGGLPPGLPSLSEAALDVEIHPDALTIHRTVGALFGGTVAKAFHDADHLSIGLIIRHGWECNRPDWGGPLQPLEAKRNRKGRVEMMYENRNEIGCMLDPETAEYNRSALHMRDTYQHWLSAMLLVRAELVELNLLPHITVNRPTIRVAPWVPLPAAASTREAA